MAVSGGASADATGAVSGGEGVPFCRGGTTALRGCMHPLRISPDQNTF